MIASTAWLATGLYIAPLLGGREPKFQKLGTDFLFWALITIVVGSTATGWIGTLQHRGVDFSFWCCSAARCGRRSGRPPRAAA